MDPITEVGEEPAEWVSSGPALPGVLVKGRSTATRPLEGATGFRGRPGEGGAAAADAAATKVPVC